jgi:hypothetical protein
MEGINMSISAVNCDNEEGPTTTATVLPKGKLQYLISIVALRYNTQSNCIENTPNEASCTG